MFIARLCSAGAAAVVALAPFAVAANVSADQVQSAHVMEADGTSGQNTNAGAGIKTNHIQNGAVTAPKLGIVCQDGYYLQYTMFAGWTCSPGTPGPAGPEGPVGPQGPAGSTPRYSNLIVVAKSGGDFDSPIAAMQSIYGASASNRFLIKIMPGEYDLGGNGVLEMKNFVDVEGSGANVTLLRNSSLGWASTVRFYGVSNAELRDLTLEISGGSPVGQCGYDGAALVVAEGTPTIANVNLRAVGSSWGAGLMLGDNSLPTLRDVNVSVNPEGLQCAGGSTGVFANAHGAGMVYVGGSIRARGPTATLAYALPLANLTLVNVEGVSEALGVEANGAAGYSASIKLYGSRIKAPQAALLNQGDANSVVFAAGTQFDGPIEIQNGGIVKLVSCFDGGFNPL